MAFLSKLYNYINDRALLSNISIKITGLCITIIILTFIYLHIRNEDKKNKGIIISGAIIRLLIVIAISFELLHYYSIYSFKGFTSQIAIGGQINFLLTFCYISVIAIFYLFFFNYKINRGYFYFFDVAILFLSIFQSTIEKLYNSRVYNNLFSIAFSKIVLFLALGLLLLSFFNFYWEKKSKIYLVYFTPLFLVFSLMSRRDRSAYSLLIFLCLAILYEFIRNWKFLKKDNIEFIISKSLIIIGVVLVILTNPFYNICEKVVLKIKEEPIRYISIDTRLLNLEEAKKMADKIRTEDDEPFKISYAKPNESFTFDNGKFGIRISTIYGKIENVMHWAEIYDDENLRRDKYRVKTDENMDKIKDFVEKTSIYDGYVKVALEDNKDITSYHDFIIYNEIGELVGKVMATEEGELMHYDVDYKYLVTSDKNNFDEKIFKKSIDEFNLKLGKTPSNYEIDVFYSNSFRFQSIGYKSGKDSFFVDGVSGKVIGYFSSIEDTSLYGNIASEDGKEIAKKYAVELNNYDLKDFDFIKKEYDRYSNETKYVFKKERADKVIYIEIHLNSNNELTRFAEREYLNPDYFKDNKINITKKDAVKMILKKYSPLEVYNTKAVPFYAVYKDGTSGLAWLVSITQFKSIKTQSYLVFSNDGSITALSDYQEGK